MTPWQIAALLTAAPLGFIMLGRGLLVVIHGRGEYDILEAVVLFGSIALLLVAFVGVK